MRPDRRVILRPVILTLDLIQTVAFAGIILFLGYAVRRLIPVLSRVNIPAPVCGGLPVAGVFAILYFNFDGYLPLKFDTALQVPLQNTFFASIGFAASLTLLKRGGPLVLLFFIIALRRRRAAEHRRRRGRVGPWPAPADGRAGRIGDADRRSGDRPGLRAAIRGRRRSWRRHARCRRGDGRHCRRRRDGRADRHLSRRTPGAGRRRDAARRTLENLAEAQVPRPATATPADEDAEAYVLMKHLVVLIVTGRPGRRGSAAGYGRAA